MPQIQPGKSLLLESLDKAWRNFDWGLPVIVAGFLMSTAPGSRMVEAVLGVSHDVSPGPFAAYQAAIAAASVKQPSDAAQQLSVIPAEPAMVGLVSLTRSAVLPVADRTFDVWAALPGELQAKCLGKKPPLLALQQILGLPPSHGQFVMTWFEAPRGSLFRPCASGDGIDQPHCSFKLPDELTAETDATLLLNAYASMRFVHRQMWESHRTGFTRSAAMPGDYPYTGVPFTVLGWSFNWAPDAQSRFGVTEFVVQRAPTIKVLATQSLDEFCSGHKPKEIGPG